jgi:hypothetical protein
MHALGSVRSRDPVLGRRDAVGNPEASFDPLHPLASCGDGVLDGYCEQWDGVAGGEGVEITSRSGQVVDRVEPVGEDCDSHVGAGVAKSLPGGYRGVAPCGGTIERHHHWLMSRNRSDGASVAVCERGTARRDRQQLAVFDSRAAGQRENVHGAFNHN